MQKFTFQILVITLVLMILGLALATKLSVNLKPSLDSAKVAITYNWPHSSAYNIEQQITSVLESGFSTIRGLEKTDSRSSKGYGRINLFFNNHTSLEMARFEVANIVRQLYRHLPQQSSFPEISVNTPDQNDQVAFLSYNIIAPNSSFDIQERVHQEIQPVIGNVKGVDKVQIYGANPMEWVISYNPEVLRNLGIAREEISNALINYFGRQSLGEVSQKNQLLTINLRPWTETTDWNIPIKKISNRLIYLNDITSIKQVEQESQFYYRVNGKNAITLAIHATEGVNTISLARKVDSKMKSIIKKLPPDYKVIQTYNSTEYLEKELLKIFKRSIYTIFILLLFILLISKSFNYLLVTTISITANLLIAFLLYYFLSLDIHLYSLAGITISLGLILDNSIVMIDHIRNHKNTKIFLPVLASTLTTVGALSVIYFFEDNLKGNLKDFALVIILNLLVSLLIALVLIPALTKKFSINKKNGKRVVQKKAVAAFYSFYLAFILFSIKYKKIFIALIIWAFGLPFFMLPTTLEMNSTVTQKTYNSTIGNEWYNEKVRPYLDIYFGGSLRLFSYYVFENSIYQKKSETKLHVQAGMEKGATVHQMNEAFLQIENYLLQFKEIDKFSTDVFSGNYAAMEITFNEPFDDGSFPFILKSYLTRKAMDLGGMEWNIYGVGDGYKTGGGQNEPINFRVEARGYKYDELNNWADTLRKRLSQHPRIKDIIIRDNSQHRRKRPSEYVLELDKERLAQMNSSPKTVYDHLRELTLSKFQDLSINVRGKYTPIRFESNYSHHFDIWHLQNNILGEKENVYSLKKTTTVTKSAKEENIYKENQEYVRLVEFQYTGAEKFGTEFLKETLFNLKKQLPLGFSFEKIELFKRISEGTSNITILLVLILFIIYFICSVLFESLKQPLIVICLIPISFIGVFLTFYLFSFNFDQGGMASFILLSGISVNASIFIISTYNNLILKHPKRKRPILYLLAFKQKIFPILLTIISSILGFIPFVIDGQEVFWFALAIGTMGGLIFSVIAIVVYLPILSIRRKEI